MSVRVSFNLDDADLEHLAAIAQQTQLRARHESADAIIAGAREVLESANRAQLAGFVKERYSRLETMLQMVADPQWGLVTEDRQRTLNALACFDASATPASPNALLDHAIMIELVSRDLHHDLEAYRDFCGSRESYGKKRAAPEADRERWLQERRAALQERMHKRRRKDRDGAASGLRKLLSLLGV
ncbi:MAG TPA: hypothetical protein VJQ52_08420 [Steroidobacteraceae bacterium]|nr:hypothetical protein [Steroidobacteraceae bacterium]